MERAQFKGDVQAVLGPHSVDVTFGDLPYGTIPNGYKGLNWDNFKVTNSDDGPQSQVAEYRDYAPASFSIANGSFDLERLTLAANFASRSLQVEIAGYANGNVAYVKDVIVHPHERNVHLNWHGIDTVVLMSYPTQKTSPYYDYYELDDVLLRHVTTTASQVGAEALHPGVFGADTGRYHEQGSMTSIHADPTHLTHLA